MRIQLVQAAALSAHATQAVNITHTALGASFCKFHLLEWEEDHFTAGTIRRYEQRVGVEEAEQWQNGPVLLCAGCLSHTCCLFFRYGIAHVSCTIIIAIHHHYGTNRRG